jgi:hypothetical protein
MYWMDEERGLLFLFGGYGHISKGLLRGERSPLLFAAAPLIPRR